MNESRRQKKVASLLKEVLSRHLLEATREASVGLISITGIEMTKDLKTAYVYISMFGTEQKDHVLDMINKKVSYFRKIIATKTNLKYNPKLIFSSDPMIEYENKIDQLIENIKTNE